MNNECCNCGLVYSDDQSVQVASEMCIEGAEITENSCPECGCTYFYDLEED